MKKRQTARKKEAEKLAKEEKKRLDEIARLAAGGAPKVAKVAAVELNP